MAPNIRLRSSVRLMAWATACLAATRDIKGDATLNSRSSNRSEGLTTLWVSGRDDTACSDRRSTSNGWTAAWLPLTRVPDHVEADGATFTVTLSTTAGVPHQRGFRTSTAVPVGDTDRTIIGPAERSIAGLKLSNPWFQPTCLAMWAGTMWSNMSRQSVYGVENFTVTVLPPPLGVTDATSR